jgi:site-specific DNA-methyltransferase (adenine-specific)
VSFEVFQADAVEWLRAIDDGVIDLCITDPAYESLEKHRKIGTTTRLKHSKSSSNDWFQIFPNSRFEELFTEVYRVLKKGSHFYMFCDQETMFIAKPIAEAAGFTLRNALVWDKVTIGMGYGYRRRHEIILYLEKGKRRLNDLSIPDVLTCPRVRGGRPTEKPVELIQTLVRQSSNHGEMVIDMFCGSGATGAAALLERRRFLGCDLSEDSVEYANTRLAAISSPVASALG